MVLAAAAGWLWARAAGDVAWGWATAASLLALALADGALFASLPRRGLSFGPAQTPFLGLSVARWLLALIAAAGVASTPAGARPGLIWGASMVGQVLVLALMAHGSLVAPFQVQVTSLEIPTPKLADSAPPLRIVQISDLHVERLTRRERDLPALVAGLVPDLIVFTGDFLSTSYNRDERALADLRWLLDRLDAPLGRYAVWGTHHVDLPQVLRPALEAAGVNVLEDKVVPLAGQRLWLLGLNCTRDLAADGARLRALLADVPADEFSLLLYHTPDLMPQAAAAGADLYLAGHTHGGQWRVPGLGAILTSSRFWKRYEAGHYRESGTDLYVSRGLGLEGFGAPRVRLFCPPEVVVVTLVGTGEGTHSGREGAEAP
jgi:uncharacterized protein